MLASVVLIVIALMLLGAIVYAEASKGELD